ncbi:MAG: hypothetical protein U0556_07620 [Dehalococcoidia bacterium]
MLQQLLVAVRTGLAETIASLSVVTAGLMLVGLAVTLLLREAPPRQSH